MQRSGLVSKRRIVAILAAALLLSACGGSQEEAETAAPTPAPVPAPEPEPVEEEAEAPDAGPTTGEKLAGIDGARVRDWPEYERRIAQAGERCGEPEIDVADKVVRVQQLLDERGMSASLLEIIEEGILASIPPSEAGNLDCAEVLSLWLVLTIG